MPNSGGALNSPNREVLEAVAGKLRPLLDELVFVGGQVVELYLSDPAAIRVRPTRDVDVVVAGTRADYHRMEEKLRTLQFKNDTSEGAPICRWKTPEGYILDLMPVDETVLGFTNRWYPAVFERYQLYSLSEDLTISIPRAPIFLATKLAAFRSRGQQDLLLSHDLEDVITLVAGRPEIVDEISREPKVVVTWLAQSMGELLEHKDFAYALPGALPDAAAMPEYRRDVLRRFEAIAALD